VPLNSERKAAIVASFAGSLGGTGGVVSVSGGTSVIGAWCQTERQRTQRTLRPALPIAAALS
jgi:hypothetical protein